MTLTKANIAQKIADDCGFMKGEASEIIEKLLEIMKSRLASGDNVIAPKKDVLFFSPIEPVGAVPGLFGMLRSRSVSALLSQTKYFVAIGCTTDTVGALAGPSDSARQRQLSHEARPDGRLRP